MAIWMKEKWRSLPKGRVFQWSLYSITIREPGGWNRRGENQDKGAILRIRGGLRRQIPLGLSEKPMQCLLELSPWMQTWRFRVSAPVPPGALACLQLDLWCHGQPWSRKPRDQGLCVRGAVSSRWTQADLHEHTAVEAEIRGRTEGTRRSTVLDSFE